MHGKAVAPVRRGTIDSGRNIRYRLLTQTLRARGGAVTRHASRSARSSSDSQL